VTAATDLESLALKLTRPGHGILAADESTGTIEKRFSACGIPCTEETRRDYRTLLFASPGFADVIAGVILYEETLFQKAQDGTPLVQLLERQGVVPGIKVDKGAKPLAGFPGETVTEGLDGLRERLMRYHEAGARFTKWRAVIAIAEGLPTSGAIEANAEALARYAALAQEQGFVPIVEPEVLMDGDHDIDRCAEATERTLHAVFAALVRHRVRLEAMILKPNMVVDGKMHAPRSSPETVALRTLAVLKRTVPAAVPAVAFLSGGQSPEEATRHLDAMNRRGPHPWRLTFSFARALQDDAMRAWAGRAENVPRAQTAFARRAAGNALATQGRYDGAGSAAAG
jgi:fructose-bisphosphate aldolase class I